MDKDSLKQIDEFQNRLRSTNSQKDRLNLINNLLQETILSGLKSHSLFYSGYIDLLAGKVETAVMNFQVAKKLEETNPLPYYGLGHAFLEKNEYDLSIDSFNTALELYPSFYLAYNGLGNVYHDKEVYTEAVDSYITAITICVKKTICQKNECKKCSQIINPSWEYIYLLKDNCHLYNKNNDYATAWNGLGNVFRRKKEISKAVKSFSKALKIDESYAFPKNGLGNIYRDIKSYSKAIQNYKDAMKDEYFAYPRNYLGDIYLYLEEYDLAIKYYEEAIKIDKNFAFPWNGLGKVYFELEKYHAAEECFRKAIAIDDEFVHAYVSLAKASIQKKENEKAKIYYNTALMAVKNSYLRSEISSAINNIENEILFLKKIETVDKCEPAKFILKETINQGLEDLVNNNQRRHLLGFVKEKSTKDTENKIYLEVLRRWNSYTPIIADSKGGGYFLKVHGKGIVLDPGFNFIDNFKASKHKFSEIDIVLVSHSHNDHTADLESIITLLYKYNEHLRVTVKEHIHNLAASDGSVEDEAELKEFNKRKKIIHFYITTSVFKKYAGLFELYTQKNYIIHIIEAGYSKKLAKGISFQAIQANHDDIISDNYSVGFVINFDDSVLIYTGDTAWSKNISKEYEKIKNDYSTKRRILLAHIGGFKNYERRFVTDELNESARDIDTYEGYYSNHLGRLGLARLCEVVSPEICFISEFGEEFRDVRNKLTNIYKDVQNICFLPSDIGLYYNIKDNKIKAIYKTDIEKCSLEYLEIDPIDVSVCELKKFYSLHYYQKTLKVTNLIQVLHELNSRNSSWLDGEIVRW